MKKFVSITLFSVLFFCLFFGLSARIVDGYSYIFSTTDASPRSITIDGDGNIYTASGNSNNVSKITPAGVSSVLGTTGSLPISITIDGDGNIYTANWSSDNVSKITPAGVSTILGTTGSHPGGITVDALGNIYTANTSSNNVSKITPAGVSTILGTTGSLPRGITLDGDGNVYTSNSDSNNVSKITPAGVSTILGTTGSVPLGITIDASGNIYTANRDSNNVSKITPAGVSTILGTAGSDPYGIIIDGDGNIYTTNSDSNNVSKITPAGASSVLGTTGSFPISITIDGDGNIYTANFSANTVTKITNPTISEVTTVPTPIVVGTALTYTFNSNSAGTITYGGSCTSATTSATAGDNSIIFDALTAGTYADCTIAVTDGFGPSNTLTVTPFTVVAVPTVTTSPATSISRTSATLNGNITATGGADATTRGFEYGLTTSYGETITQSSGPYSTGTFDYTLSDLNCNTAYHYRAYATNIAGTSYGSDDSFITSSCLVSGGGGGGSTKPPTPSPVTPPPIIPPPLPPPIITPPTTPPPTTPPLITPPIITPPPTTPPIITPPPTTPTTLVTPPTTQPKAPSFSVWGNIREILTNQIVTFLRNLFLALALIPSLLVLASLLLAGMPFLNYLLHLLVVLSQILGFKKKPKPWGTVYDSYTKRPLPYARVEILNDQARKLQSAIADENGRYGFLISEQLTNIKLQAYLTKYDFPSKKDPSVVEQKLYPNIYKGELINASSGLANYDLPMDPRSKIPVFDFYLGISSIKVNNFLSSTANVLFLVGAILGIANAIVNPSVTSITILGIILLTFTLRNSGFKLKPFGLTKDRETNQTLPFGLIALHNQGGERVSFTVSDDLGRYFLLIPKGNYTLKAYTPSHIIPTRTKEIAISTRKGWISREVKV